MDRRDFFKIIGIGAGTALVSKGVWEVVKPKELFASVSEEKTSGGLRWGMAVLVERCAMHPECTKCTEACHKAHNVPHFDEKRHEIKWIWREEWQGALPDEVHPFMGEAVRKKLVPVLCNHCENPACVKVCPTKATFKRKDDGIVMMDMHRCIGCRYCMAACPYGSRSFNFVDPRKGLKETSPDYPTRTKGVVEKCNFCEDVIAREGQNAKPYCVRACPYGALVFGNLFDENSEIRKVLASHFSLRRKQNLGTGPAVFYCLELGVNP